MRTDALVLLAFAAVYAPIAQAQDTLMGCGPFYGTDCERSGVDLTGSDASVLMRSWAGAGVMLPGARAPQFPDGGEIPVLVRPFPGPVFEGEMAALSWNFLTLLVAYSSHGEAPNQFDPNDPYAYYDPTDPSTLPDQGQCSFLQPQYCESVQAIFGVAEPPAPPTEPELKPLPHRIPAVGRSSKRAGCLPPARGLASLSAGRPAIEVGRRSGRCPKR